MNTKLADLLPRVLRLLLLAVIFFYVFFLVSHSFDYDLGWHLRFGKEVWEEQSFPYYDTYTWAHYGQKWINHEWGGDALFWFIYSRFGYVALVALTSLALSVSLVLAQRIFSSRISTVGLVVGLFAVWSVKHVMVMRLALFGPLFFVLLWYTLEQLPRKKLYYWWPPLLWLWSILHGSWILGFIVIGIYIFGNLTQHALQKYTTFSFPHNTWRPALIVKAIVATLVAGLVIAINPYGFGIWQEVLQYFSASYFKAWITEWLPTYAAPLFWNSFPILGAGLCAFAAAARKKMLTLPQLLLGIAFFISAWQYKRNVLFFALVCAPLFTLGLEYGANALRQTGWWKRFWGDARIKNLMYAYGGMVAILLLTYYATQARFDRDIWQQTEFLRGYRVPVAAAEFLKTTSATKKLYLFNYFSWGGYLTWQAPEALLFLDGRGTATWRLPGSGENSLKQYIALMTKPGGLKKLERGPTNYILLKKENYSLLPELNAFDRFVFTNDHPPTIYRPAPSQLAQDLTTSTRWTRVYSDDRAEIWERTTSSATREN